MKYAAITLATAVFGAIVFVTVFPVEGGIARLAPLPMFKPADECDWRPQVKTMLWEARRRGVNVSDDWQSIEEQMLDAESRCLMQVDAALHAIKRREEGR
jgi:hypothetical protein